MDHKINIDYATIDSIKPYPGNTKRHPDSEIDKLAAMIEAYGFDQPIVVDKDMVIIKGHGRLLAHKKIGSELVPIVIRDDLSPALVKASRIADNKSNESEWDLELLAIEFDELKEMDFDIELIGFDDFKFSEHENLQEEIDHEEPEYHEEPEIIAGIPLLIDNCPRIEYKKFMSFKKQMSLKKNYEVIQHLLGMVEIE